MRITGIAAAVVLFAAACGGQESRSPEPVVRLPGPVTQGRVSLEQALGLPAGERRLLPLPLSPAEIGQMLWAGLGTIDPRAGLRMAPAQAAQYPVQLYAVTESGAFGYDAAGHNLRRIQSGDVRGRLSTAALGQDITASAPCSILVAGYTRALMAAYGPKARTYLLLEAGHVAQNIQLQAAAMGLATSEIGAFDAKGVARLCRLPKNVEPLLIICAGHPAAEIAPEEQADEPPPAGPKRALMVIASGKFRDEEMFDTQYVLERARIETVVASAFIGPARGILGRRTEATVLLQDVDVGDYDAIVFVGGSGSRQYFTDPLVLDMARRAAEQKKVVAAVSTAPAILANAGLLGGIRATAFPTEKHLLQNAGAIYTGEEVERAGNIITARGPETARHFARAIVEALERRD
jgi:protease I